MSKGETAETGSAITLVFLLGTTEIDDLCLSVTLTAVVITVVCVNF